MCTLVYVCLSVVEEHLGLHEFLCAWKCVLCVVVCVCVHRPVDGAYLFNMHLVYLCVCYVCTQYMHIGRRLRREKILNRLSD